jgi:hypothetical protein
MPRAYPAGFRAEFRARALALVRAGKPQKQTAEETFPGEDNLAPKGSTRWSIASSPPGRRSTDARILGVARQNYYQHKRTPTTPRQLRREWLTGLIREDAWLGETVGGTAAGTGIIAGEQASPDQLL